MIREHIDLIHYGMSEIGERQVNAAADAIYKTARHGGTVYTAGNGSSAALSLHAACDFMKGAAQPPNKCPVVSLASNMALITALGNDIAFEDVFVEQLKRQLRPYDSLFLISASGNSPNIVKAAKWTCETFGPSVEIISLTGFDGGELVTYSDVSLHIDIDEYEAVEDVHHIIMHIIAKKLKVMFTTFTHEAH